jgi:hypothetical protein
LPIAAEVVENALKGSVIEEAVRKRLTGLRRESMLERGEKEVEEMEVYYTV